jgi:hypothetical protein
MQPSYLSGGVGGKLHAEDLVHCLDMMPELYVFSCLWESGICKFLPMHAYRQCGHVDILDLKIGADRQTMSHHSPASSNAPCP